MAGFDDIKRRGLTGSRLEQLLQDRERRLTTPSVAETRISERLKTLESELATFERILSRNRLGGSQQDIGSAEQAVASRKLQIKTQMSRQVEEEMARQEAAEHMFGRSLRSGFGQRATTSELARLQRSSSIMQGSIGNAQTRSTSSIESSILRKERLLERQTERVAAESEGGELTFGLQMRAGGRDAILKSLAADKAQLAMQKKMGIDIGSRYYDARKLASGVSATMAEQGIVASVARGETGTQANMAGRLQQVNEQIIETFSKFEDALNSGADNVDELADKMSELSGKHSEYTKTLSEMQKQGVGRGFSDKLADILGTVGEVGMIAQGVGQGYRYQTVTSELQREQIRTGFGGIANQRFDEALGATRGNMRDLRRVTTGRYGSEIAKSLGIARQSDIAQLMQFGGSAAQSVDELGMTAVSAAMKGTAASTLGGPLSGIGVGALSMTEDLAGGMPTLLQTHRLGVDYFKQLTTGQDLIAAQQTYRTQDITKNAIADQSMQETADFMRSLGRSTRGLGGGRAGVQGAFMDPAMISNLASVGLDLDSIPGIIAGAKQELGAGFRGPGATADVMRAGQLARTGMLDSAGQMFQMRGALAGVGGGQGNLETIMRQAVAQGMDSSKNINEMVQATTRLSERSAAMGIDAVAGAEQVSGRAFQALSAMGLDPNMRAGAAASAAGLAQSAYGNTGLNLGNIIERAGINKAFSGSTFLEREVMGRLTADQLETLKREGPEAAAQFGLENVLKTSTDIDNLVSASREGAEINITGVGIDRKGEQLKRKARNSGVGSLSEKERAYLTRYQRQIGVINKVQGDATFAATNVGGGVFEQAGPPDPTGASLNTEEMERAGAMGGSKLFESSVEKFGKFIGGVDKLGSAMVEAAKQLDPEKMAATTEKAMEQFSVPTEAFGTHVAKFETSVGSFVDAVDQIKERLASSPGSNGPTLKSMKVMRFGRDFMPIEYSDD